jgi:Ni/Co efflux regulator RcnB
MNKILLSAAALAAILAAPAAMADPNDNQPNQHDSARPDRGDNNPGDAMKGPNDNTSGPNDMQNNGPRGSSNDNDRMRDNNNRDNDRTVNKTVNRTVVHKTVNRDVVLKARANITAPRRFHAAKAYVRPTGWYAHRWTYGERLPRAFFAPDYFLLDFAAYGLIAPWDGYAWVRYGDDALLIDTDSGEVIRVEYDLFD